MAPKLRNDSYSAWFRTPWLIDRPSPVPSPEGLVVKNGLNIFSFTVIQFIRTVVDHDNRKGELDHRRGQNLTTTFVAAR